MTITWLGHSCFCIEQDGYQIITDPYRDVDGYPPLHVKAHEVFCSHDHYDHNYLAGVTLLPKRRSPFTVREVASFHDHEQGKKRGKNTIRCFSANGMSVCHLGDLGHLLSDEQVREIGKVDVLLIPVGGVFTIGPEEAKHVIRQIRPRCAIPMHYRHAPYGLPNLGGVELFLEQFCSGSVKVLPGRTLNVTPTLPEIAVPSWH